MEKVIEAVKHFFTPEVFLNNIFVIVTIRLTILILILNFIHIVITFLTRGITKKITDREHAKQVHTIIMTLKSFIDIVVSLIFIMAFLTRIGIDIRPILTAAGVLGVAVGFGSKRFVEDIISGVMLILEGQIRVGDIIEIGDRFGTVERLNLKMVVLRDVDGKVHYIRNGMIDIVTNYTRDYSYALLDIGIAYKENADKVMEIIKDIAQNELLQENCGKFITGKIEMLGITEFKDSSVNIKFRIKTLPMHQWEVTREFNRLIKNKFDELNIEIPFPQRTLHIEKEKIEQIS